MKARKERKGKEGRKGKGKEERKKHLIGEETLR